MNMTSSGKVLHMKWSATATSAALFLLGGTRGVPLQEWSHGNSAGTAATAARQRVDDNWVRDAGALGGAAFLECRLTGA